jgi:hypothetical protein
MSSFTLTNTADEIDSAISRVNSADATPIANSQSMVTSGGVKAALDNLATGGSLTVDSFDPSAIEDSNDGLTLSDSVIPTSKAVLENDKKLSAWITIATTTANMPIRGFFGTAANDMILMGQQGSRNNDNGRVYYYQAPYGTIGASAVLASNGDAGFVTIPIAKGEYWRVWFNSDISACTLIYREFV